MRQSLKTGEFLENNDSRAGILLFVVLAYTFTWSFHLAIPFLDLSFSFDLASPAMWLYLVGLTGPSASAILVTAYYTGKPGVVRLLKTALVWRVHPGWYLFSVLAVPVITFIALLSTWQVTTAQLLSFPHLLILGQVWVVTGEEFGWRGFAQPRLQARLGSIGAAIVLGVFWAGWHLPVFFVRGAPQYTDSFLVSFPLYVLIVIFWTILMAMLYNRTGASVLISMLFHASINVAGFTIRTPETSLLICAYVPLVAVSIALLPEPWFSWKSG